MKCKETSPSGLRATGQSGCSNYYIRVTNVVGFIPMSSAAPSAPLIFQFAFSRLTIAHSGDEEAFAVAGRRGADPVAVRLGEERHAHRAFPLRAPEFLAGLAVERGDHLELLVLRFGGEHPVTATMGPRRDTENPVTPREAE